MVAGGGEVTRAAAAAAVHSPHPHYLTRGAAAVPRLTGDPYPSAASGSQYLANFQYIMNNFELLFKTFQNFCYN